VAAVKDPFGNRLGIIENPNFKVSKSGEATSASRSSRMSDRFTDAYTKAWEPSEKPFMTVILTGLPCKPTNPE